ncbi:MAG TPA: hypothetical protein VMF08_09230 [Candidatus Sulfotelmatobacter sp.]|nr:hypothetical protein [Candidatus Sulfotelmatobacter sp.]
MSDLSIIAHDYELNAEFARKFNEAVLNLKRVYLLRRAATPDTQANVGKSRNDLRQLLESLISALEDQGKTWTADQAQVPADVLERLHKRLKGELPETILEFRRVTEILTKGAALDEAAFAALDRVCEAADATASAAFRRLRRI